MRIIKYIVIHCTAGPQNQRTSEIQAMWRRMGWRNQGYHFLYSADGTEEELAPISQIVNGVAGFNSSSIHLSYKGGVGSRGEILDNRTPAQEAAMWNRVKRLKEQFPSAAIMGHRDFSPDRNRNGIIESSEWIKACPSFSVKEWVRQRTEKENVQPQARTVRTSSGGNVNVRSGVSTSNPIIGQLKSGSNILVLESRDGWSKIALSGRTEGWISNQFIQ